MPVVGAGVELDVEVEVDPDEVVEAGVGYWTSVTLESGYSWEAPLMTSWSAPPEATFDASIPVTVPVVGASPLPFATVTWAPRKELPVARLWDWAWAVACCRVVNCASWVMVWVGSIG